MSNFSPVCRVQTDNIQLNRCIHMILDKEERRKTLKFNFIFKLLLFFLTLGKPNNRIDLFALRDALKECESKKPIPIYF